MFFFINFIRILWFLWDLKVMLLDSAEDEVVGEILVFTNIFYFSGLNKAQKWTKTVNFGYVPLRKNSKFWKVLQILCLHNERIPLLKILAKSSLIWGERGPNPPKWAISWMLNRYENLWNFITWQPQMLYIWNLPRLSNFIRPLFWHKLGAYVVGRKRA